MDSQSFPTTIAGRDFTSKCNRLGKVIEGRVLRQTELAMANRSGNINSSHSGQRSTAWCIPVKNIRTRIRRCLHPPTPPGGVASASPVKSGLTMVFGSPPPLVSSKKKKRSPPCATRWATVGERMSTRKETRRQVLPINPIAAKDCVESSLRDTKECSSLEEG